jgi:Domain of unknown function (DUF4350)
MTSAHSVVEPIEVTPGEVTPGEVVRPLWRRTRFWLAMLAALVAGGLLVALVGPRGHAPLDPESPSKGGAKALAQILDGYGIEVARTTDLDVALGAGAEDSVLVVDPRAYSAGQLDSLRSRAARIVLLEPAPESSSETVDGVVVPGCSLPGAQAAGPVDFGSGATTYPAEPGTVCYEGAVVADDATVRIGSADLLRNDHLARRGVAALDVNLLSVDRTVRRVVWLMPGADAAGSTHVNSVWDLFPAGAHRAFLWLLLTGLVVVLWRARRLGPPVPEPLPVIVRAAEAIEGHGRLYR